MILSELVPPEEYELTQAVMTTFDLDLAVLKSFPGLTDAPGKYTVFRGEGEFTDLPVSDPVREALLASVVTVPFPKMKDGRPAGYAHGKIALFDHVRAGEHLYHLLITSANISAYDNLETYTVFSGRETGMEQAGTLPLIDYMNILNSYAEGRLDDVIERLREVRFTPLPEYACEEHSFIALCPGKTSGEDILSEPFDELLVIAPFINCKECLSLATAANENARLVILSQTPEIRRLIKDGLITEASGLPVRLHLIPQSKTQKYIHAKIYLRRTGKEWDLFTGSMNLTPFAMTRNLEFMVRRVRPLGISSLEDYLTSFFSGSVSEEDVRHLLSSDDDCFIKTDSGFCRRAASPELRQAQLSDIIKRNKYPEDQADLITEYLLSPQCSVDIINMLHGNESAALPVRRRSVAKGKSRETYVFSLKDRILQGMVNRALHDFDSWSSPKLYSHIKGRNKENILTEIRQYPNFGDLWIFKTDIHDYDGSMDADILSGALRHIPGLDPLCITFLETFISRHAYLENGILHNDAPAVQTGSPLCGFFENIYLRDIDIMLTEKAAFYARYADDILFAASTEEELDGLIHTLIQELEKKKLKLNESKTLLLAPGTSFAYLGWNINGDQVDLSSKKLVELRTAIRAETKRLLIACKKNHLPEKMRLFLVISRANRLIDLWGLSEVFRVVSVHDGLREIDRMFYDMIRIVASGKTGSSRYRIRHEQIIKWGYKSLVNRYYRFIRR